MSIPQMEGLVVWIDIRRHDAQDARVLLNHKRDALTTMHMYPVPLENENT